jgi:undecaprenyl diphosphate synthase
MHIAIIMDGNGRWAEQRGLPRTFGHRAGAKAVRRVVEAAARLEIDCLSLYAFSSDNWSRPPDEVSNLMGLFKRYLQSEISRCLENNIRLNIIGRRDRLNDELVRFIERAEQTTAECDGMLLRVAVDYSSRDAVAMSAHHTNGNCSCIGNGHVRGCFEAALAKQMHAADGAGDVDLLIRSGGERRLSDFMLWECAYAELVFVDTFWPDFGQRELGAALSEFELRDRRFGRVENAEHRIGA